MRQNDSLSGGRERGENLLSPMYIVPMAVHFTLFQNIVKDTIYIFHTCDGLKLYIIYYIIISSFFACFRCILQVLFILDGLLLQAIKLEAIAH